MPCSYRSTYKALLFAYATVTILVTTGCSTFTGRPQRSDHAEQILADLKKDEGSKLVGLIKSYHSDKKSEAEQRMLRNQIIDLGQLEIDQYYNLFLQEFTTSKKTFDTMTELGAILADSASAAFTPASTKTILSLAAGGLTASRTSVGKNFFYEQSLKALVQQMTAERRAVARDLLVGTAADLSSYPLAAALQDLERYYFAGTIDGAFAGVVKDAAAKELKANQEIQNQIKSVLSAKRGAEKWLEENGLDAGRTKLKAWYAGLSDPAEQYKARAVLTAAAINSELTPEQIANSVAGAKRGDAIDKIKADRNPPRKSTFIDEHLTTLDLAVLIDLLPGSALANFIGAYAGTKILQ